MKKNVRVEKITRKELADPNYNMKYTDRLNKANLNIVKDGLETEDCGNGFTRIKKMRLI